MEYYILDCDVRCMNVSNQASCEVINYAVYLQKLALLGIHTTNVFTTTCMIMDAKLLFVFMMIYLSPVRVQKVSRHLKTA